MGSAGFTVLPMPGTPLVLAPGRGGRTSRSGSRRRPGATDTATIRIESNDPGAPVVDLLATALAGTARCMSRSPTTGDFGEVCLGELRRPRHRHEQPRHLRPSGVRDHLLGRAVHRAGRPCLPARRRARAAVESRSASSRPVRGPVAATLTSSATIRRAPRRSGPRHAPPPRLVVSIADTGDFGETCLGSFQDRR